MSGDEMVSCIDCGVTMPALFMHAAILNGQYLCGRCWGENEDDDEFEDRDEHTRD